MPMKRCQLPSATATFCRAASSTCACCEHQTVFRHVAICYPLLELKSDPFCACTTSARGPDCHMLESFKLQVQRKGSAVLST